jgi:hypothetical protein
MIDDWHGGSRFLIPTVNLHAKRWGVVEVKCALLDLLLPESNVLAYQLSHLSVGDVFTWVFVMLMLLVDKLLPCLKQW